MRVEDFSGRAQRNLTTVRFPATVHSSGRRSESIESPAFVPPPLPPDLEAFNPRKLPATLWTLLVEAEGAMREVNGLVSNLPNPDLFIGPLIQREAILSSRIENTFATPRQLALFELWHDKQDTDESRRTDVREVWNYVQALRQGLGDRRPLSLNLLRNLHRTLLNGVRGAEQRPGEFRDIPVAIGKEHQPLSEATFIPCPPGDVMRERLDNLERYINEQNDASDALPPLMRIAVAHYQFEAIHPFRDGNGRVGRLLVTLQLCRQTRLTRPFVHVSAFFERHRDEYYGRLLRVSTHEEWTEWVGFFLEAVAAQACEAESTAKKLIDLRNSYLERIREKRSSANLGKLIDFLFEAPWVNVKTVARLLGVTPAMAGRTINKLRDKGIVQEITGNKRHRVFAAMDILNLIHPEQ